MASSVKPEQQHDDDHLADAGHHDDAENAFIERTAAKYEKADRRASDDEDGMEADEEEDEGASASADDEDEESPDDEEHTDEDTSDEDRDGDASESGEDSTEGDDTDHTEDEESEESEEDAADEDDADETDEDEEDAEDEDGELSEELTAAANRHKIPVTVDDIKDATARQLVTQKLKEIDAGYTRAMQEARAFRKEQAQFRADQQYREANAELAVVETISAALKKDPQFIEKVQARLDKLEDADAREAFEVIVGKKKSEAREAIVSQMDELDRRLQRADVVESTARKTAARLGLPWRYAEKEIVLALAQKPDDKKDLSEDEIVEVLKAEAAAYAKDQRALRRTASKEKVKAKTVARKTVAAAPAKGRQAKDAASPRPAPKKPKEVDPDNEDERIEAGMALARKLFPGKKDK